MAAEGARARGRSRLDREPAAAQNSWGSAGALDAGPRLRSLERAVPGPEPGFVRAVSRGSVADNGLYVSYAPRSRVRIANASLNNLKGGATIDSGGIQGERHPAKRLFLTSRDTRPPHRAPARNIG